MYSIYLSKEKFKNHMELLLIENADKAQSDKLDYVYIKDVNRCVYNKTKQKAKNIFGKNCLQCFVSDRIMTNHKKGCLYMLVVNKVLLCLKKEE